MSKHAKQQSFKSKSRLDAVLWTLVIVLVAAAIGADYYYSSIPGAIRIAGWIVFAGFIVAIIMQTQQGKKVWQFTKGARTELRKVVWPTRHETIRTTAIVGGLVLLTALIMWGADSIIMKIIGWLTGQRG